ncbi:MAG: hypothetical protein ABW153_02015 [Sedimenticola sp.]
MEMIDTGKVQVASEGDQYLLFTFYSHGEVTTADALQIRKYLDRFNGQVPILIHRKASYSLATDVQLMLMKEAGARFSAAAYMERGHQDVALTNLAKATYMKDVRVRSFWKKGDAIAWLNQFGGLPPKHLKD